MWMVLGRVTTAAVGSHLVCGCYKFRQLALLCPVELFLFFHSSPVAVVQGRFHAVRIEYGRLEKKGGKRSGRRAGFRVCVCVLLSEIGGKTKMRGSFLDDDASLLRPTPSSTGFDPDDVDGLDDSTVPSSRSARKRSQAEVDIDVAIDKPGRKRNRSLLLRGKVDLDETK